MKRSRYFILIALFLGPVAFADSWSESIVQQQFEAQVQSQGLEAFVGSWKLIRAQGTECADQVSAKLDAQKSLHVDAVGSSKISRPSFVVISVDGNDHRGIGWNGAYSTSSATLEKTRILSTESVRGFFSFLQIHREVELTSDGSLIFAANEVQGTQSVSYRCVYGR